MHPIPSTSVATRSPDPLVLRERRRDRQAEGLRGLEVDEQLELGRLLLHGQVGVLGAIQDSVDMGGGPMRSGDKDTDPRDLRGLLRLGGSQRG